MSNSYNYNYLPIPPRVWSRVQNPCTYVVPDNSYNSIYIPLINETTTLAQANYLEKVQYKGNILQYKGNSSRITKNQKYSQISKGLWANRTKVYATQTQTYTNPNTIGLARVNYTNIPFPNQIVGSPNNISGPFQYGIPNPFDCSTNTIQDGGSLICNAYANPCTGQIIQTVSQQQCFPTYCSDVPGQIMDLCWNPALQTFFPRRRFTMSNSLNKWPQGYKGFQSAITPIAPVLLTATNNLNAVTLNWSYSNNICIPVSSFQIYQNGILVQTVPYTINSTAINSLSYNITYSFYIVAISNNISSANSNSLNVFISQPQPPTVLTYPITGAFSQTITIPIDATSYDISVIGAGGQAGTIVFQPPLSPNPVTILGGNQGGGGGFTSIFNWNEIDAGIAGQQLTISCPGLFPQYGQPLTAITITNASNPAYSITTYNGGNGSNTGNISSAGGVGGTAGSIIGWSSTGWSFIAGGQGNYAPILSIPQPSTSTPPYNTPLNSLDTPYSEPYAIGNGGNGSNTSGQNGFGQIYPALTSNAANLLNPVGTPYSASPVGYGEVQITIY